MATLNRILVPTDFSENATAVFEFVRQTAKKYDAQIDLVYIIPELTYLKVGQKTIGNPFEAEGKFAAVKINLEKKLKAEMQNHIPEQYRGTIFVKNASKPSKGILALEKKKEYDLIIIASRGLGNSIFTRGHVTNRLIRLSNTPVLSINKTFKSKIDKIVVPIDGSAVSFEALPMALKIAKENDASIQLLSITKMQSDKFKLLGREARMHEYAAERLKQDVLENLNAFIEGSKRFVFTKKPSLKEAKISYIEHEDKPILIEMVSKDGVSAHRSIVEQATEHADIVVMTTHGRSKLSGIFLGSIAEKVVRHLKMPVLTVKPEFAKKKL